MQSNDALYILYIFLIRGIEVDLYRLRNRNVSYLSSSLDHFSIEKTGWCREPDTLDNKLDVLFHNQLYL